MFVGLFSARCLLSPLMRHKKLHIGVIYHYHTCMTIEGQYPCRMVTMSNGRRFLKMTGVNERKQKLLATKAGLRPLIGNHHL